MSMLDLSATAALMPPTAMADLRPATTPTMYFIGVTTGRSSIMRVFPAWAERLGIYAQIRGIDLSIHADPSDYIRAVDFIKCDPLSQGALVTTHKLDLFRAAKDLFDRVAPETALLGEVSSISKRGAELWGHAMDPQTSGLSLQAIAPSGYWATEGAELLILGAGGSSLALTLYLHRLADFGVDVPRRVTVTNRSPERLQEMREIHLRLGFGLPVAYRHTPDPRDNDRLVAELPPASLVINATGLGKDRPGSPLTDEARFPERAIAWDFNYRGDLVFLDQARAQASRGVRVEDGWLYFIHGWTRVIAEVFHIDIPTRGTAFDALCEIATRVAQDAGGAAR